MNNKQLQTLLMLEPDIQTIVDWMSHNDPNGSYSKCDLILHSAEYIDILNQWVDDADVSMGDPLYELMQDFIDTTYLVYVVSTED